MHRAHSLLILTFAASAAAPAAAQRAPSPELAPALASIEAAHLRAHIAFLADDMLEGRAPGTRGGALAARYIATRFERTGLEPLSNEYLHYVPLNGWRAIADSIDATVATFGQRTPLRYPDDVVLWTEARDGSARVDAELVFAGYGIHAPEYDWDDYGDVDVRGKAVLVLIGEPAPTPDAPDRFDGSLLSRYARWTYKVEEAGRRGAAAVLLVHEPQSAGYDWNVVRASWTSERFALRDSAPARPLLRGWVRAGAIRPILAAAARGGGRLEAAAGRPGFHARPLGVSLRARAVGRTRRVDSPNVIGVLPGSNPARRGEVVMVTAHYDHLGLGPAVDGDSIYNGAYDNASGVAALLEVAEAFAHLASPAERSILFLATTAEENGLLGANAFVRAPPVPLENVVAVLNLDGVNLWGETHDVITLGGTRSTLGDLVRSRAGSLGMVMAPEPAPEAGLLYRTDIAPFAREGVPAVGIMHGTSFRGQPPGWGDLFLGEWEARHYHRPSDDFDPFANLSGAVQQTRLTFLVAFDAARGARPTLHRPLSALTR